MNHLDDFDIQILKQLEADGRMAYSAIATELGVSNTMADLAYYTPYGSRYSYGN